MEHNLEVHEKFALLKAKIRSKVESGGGSADAVQTLPLTEEEMAVARQPL